MPTARYAHEAIQKVESYSSISYILCDFSSYPFAEDFLVQSTLPVRETFLPSACGQLYPHSGYVANFEQLYYGYDTKWR